MHSLKCTPYVYANFERERTRMYTERLRAWLCMDVTCNHMYTTVKVWPLLSLTQTHSTNSRAFSFMTVSTRQSQWKIVSQKTQCTTSTGKLIYKKTRKFVQKSSDVLLESIKNFHAPVALFIKIWNKTFTEFTRAICVSSTIKC